MTKTVNEEFAAADHDANGKGSVFPDPVDTGSTARPQDNTSNGEAGVVHAPGVGDVPRSAELKALLMKLAGLPAEVLAQIANDIDANNDVNNNPSGATDGDQARNLASILSVKEDVAELFAGEELTEEFMAKATVIFEAAVGARVALIEAELTEKLNEEKEAEIATAVEAITEELVDKMDRYLSFAAEEFVNENKVEIESTIHTTLAEQFMADMFELASKYNVNVPQQDINVVEDLTAQVAELTQKLNESLESNIDTTNKVKELEVAKSFVELTEGLTATQRERVSQLVENVDYGSAEEYTSKLKILCETVTASGNEKKLSSTLITESTVDGVPLVTEEETAQKAAIDPTVAGTLAVLQRMK